MTKVLFVDDDRAMCEATSSELLEKGFEVTARTNAQEAFDLLGHEPFDVVVTDLNMAGLNGIELAQRISDNHREIPVIAITAFGSLETAIATIRAGAFDFVQKPFDVDELVVAIERAARYRSLQREVRRLQTVLENPLDPSELIGNSSAMQSVRSLVARVAATDVGMLVTGESGTGKELVARAIHRLGPHATGPFVAVNCAAIPEALLESELFGHTKGAFTDAKTQRRGLFVEADNGTLFLDEIGEMPLSMQVKLLRALEERAVRPVGSNTVVPFRTRVVAATNRNLETAVKEQAFREDLYYRIHVVHIQVPPLRERAGDVLELATHFLRRAAERQGKAVTTLAPQVADKLLAYTWPGNVRELLNCMERAVALAQFEEIKVEDLPERIRAYSARPLVVTADADELVSLEELERRYVARVMEAVGGNKSSAARVLGVDRTTLYRMLDRFDLR